MTIDEIGGAALYLLSDLSTGVTGDIHFVDSGYNIISMPQPGAPREEIIERARLLALPARVVGRVGGNSLTLRGEATLTLDDLRAGHEAWLPKYMGTT